MKTWLSTDQTEQLTGWSDRHIRRLRAAGKIDGRDVDGRPQYSLESLPAEAQLKYVKEFALVPLAAEPAPKAIVSVELEAKAKERLEPVVLLRRFIDDRKAGAPTVEVKFADGTPVRNSDDYAKWLAPQHGLTASGLWKRYQRYYKGGGLVALSGARSDRGKSRAFTKKRCGSDAAAAAAKKFVLGLYADEGDLNLRHIYDELCLWWPKNINHGSKPPSESAMRLFLATEVPNVVREAARLPKSKFDQRNAPALRGDYITKLQPNDIWVSDHRIHDVFFYNDCFTTKKKLAWLRIWETSIEDMRTRTIVGTAFSVSPSSRTIASALRAAINRYGLPEVFYVDNGKDYRKIGKGALHADVQGIELDDQGRVPMDRTHEGLLGRLGIKVLYCEPRHPQSKLIESYFQQQSRRQDRYFGKAYAGQRPDLRPDACALSLKQHELFLKGQLSYTPLPAASIGIQIGFHWNDWFNTQRPHGGHGMDGKTPHQVFDELLPEERRHRVDVTQIAELFWEDRHTPTVRNAKVRLHSGVYEGADNVARHRLYALNGQVINVACDPTDLSEAVAYGPDGAIFRLRSEELVARGLNRSLDEVKAMHAKVADIQEFRRGARRGVMGALRAIRSGVPTPLQLIGERAGVNVFTQPNPEDVVRALPLAAAGGAAAVRAAAGPEEVAERNLDWLITPEEEQL